MSNIHSQHGDQQDLDAKIRIDRLCDSFEKDWVSNGTADLSSYIEQADHDIRKRVVMELVLLDRHYLAQKKSPITKTDYLERFPEHADAIEQAFAEISEPTRSPRTQAHDACATVDSSATVAPGLGGMIGKQVRYFGDYEIVEEIARGGMGVVYRAKQISLNRVIALKMILAGQIAGEDQIRRFQLEAEAAANLDHPGIVPIYDIGQHEGQHYFSMKLIEGKTLSQLGPELAQDHNQAIEMVSRIADAVHHAHQRGILHRDLKPGNVLVDEQDNPMITDFGLARDTKSDQQHTASGAVIGTPGFMSPEQAAGKGVTTATDIYSLGAILYQVLCGRPPHQGDSMMATLMSVMNDPPDKLRSINSDIHPDLELICLKCLEKDPNNRYASASEFAADLRAFQRSEPLHVRAPSLIELARMWLAGNYGNVVWVPIIAMIVGIGSGIGIWIMAFGGRRPTLESIYSSFARDDQPLWAFYWITQELIQYVAVPILFLATIAIGWATARLVKPKNAAADWGAGLAVGLLSGLLAFMCGAGAPLIDSQLESGDMDLLFKLAANAGSPSATNELLERYPSLTSQTPYNRAVLLYNKTTYGLKSGMTVGIWNGTLFCLFWFGISGAIQTWVAGPLVRNQSRVSGPLSYLCFAFAWVAIVFIVFGEGWITLVVGAGMILDWAAPIACIIFALLTMYAVITNRGWPIKAFSTLAWASLFILFFMQTYASTDNLLHSVANTRAEIAKAEQLVARNPSSNEFNLKLAQANFNFAIALHERGRFESAIEQHEKALNQLLRFSPPQDLSEPERALYSSILYWSSLDAFETGDSKTAADRMLQHVQFFPYSSRFVLKLYAQSVLALGDSIEVADYITPAAKDSPDQWRVTINLINALTQVGQSSETPEDQKVDDQWRSRVVDEMLDRATGNVEDESWVLRRKQLRQWMLSQQSWQLYGPLDIPVNADQQKVLANPTEIEKELLSRSGTAKPTTTYTALPQTQVDFTKLFERTEHAIAYATGDFELKESQEVTFRFAADDLHELWIDEELVHQNVGVVGIMEGRQQFTHKLDQGKHRVMIKVTQGIGEWGFIIEAADSEGWPLPIWENADVLDARHGN